MSFQRDTTEFERGLQDLLAHVGNFARISRNSRVSERFIRQSTDSSVFPGSPAHPFDGESIALNSSNFPPPIFPQAATISLSAIEVAAQSVGLLELATSRETVSIGTAWVVASGLLATNRHVLTTAGITRGTGTQAKLIATPRPYTLSFVLGEQAGSATRFRIQITEIAWLADVNEPDVAYLRLPAMTGVTLSPLPLATAVAAEMAAIIGHPSSIENTLNEMVLTGIPPNGEKRIAFGPIAEVNQDSLVYEASAFDGSSGSPVVNLRGQVLGMHYDGIRTTLADGENWAVPSEILAEILLLV